MNPVDLSAFQRIVTAHGNTEGAAYFDAEESIVHDIYPERIVFQTNFMDNRSYAVDIADGALRVQMTRLDNYHRGHKAQVIDDDMDEDDWEELAALWQRLSLDLAPQTPTEPFDPADTLADLFFTLFDEDRAEALVQQLPPATGAWDWAWSQLAAALAQSNQLAEFEWKEWATYGIAAVNALAPLRELGIEIAPPDSKQIAAINRADDWERALLQYFNAQLDAHDLKLLALGTHFDEYQAFACLPMNGLGLANALELMGKLKLVYRF